MGTRSVFGVIALLLYPLMMLWPSGWAWHRLIWFTVWSSVVHGSILAVQSIVDLMERGHLIGDVPALFIVAIVLAVLTPRRTAAQVANRAA